MQETAGGLFLLLKHIKQSGLCDLFYPGNKPMKKLREKEMYLEFIINRKMSKLAGDKTRGEYDNRPNQIFYGGSLYF